MANYPIAVIVGSLRKDSLNRKLAEGLAKLAPADVSFTFADIGSLPLYNQDEDANQPASVLALKKVVAEAKGVLFVTPEYNRSIPGVLKNAIDHGSRPYGKSVWGGKPTGIIGASPGAMGTGAAQQHLRTILAMLDAYVMGQPEGFIQVKDGLFNEDGSIGEASRAFLQKWVDSYVAWVKRFA